MTDTLVPEATAGQRPLWLLFIHQIPPKPDYFRVKVRRRLERIGARAIKNSVYVLPNTEEAMEDSQWLLHEIQAEGGEAMVCEATFVGGRSDRDIAALFTESGSAAGAAEPAATSSPSGATWVTRRGVKVDRMASAWLIRRFIDPAARFRFVAARGYRPEAGEIRFDMYEGEYTHVGDACTFETLLARFALDDPALHRVAEMVHDVDCKDEKFARADTPGFAGMMDGIIVAHADDAARVERAAALCDDLYAHFRRRG